MLGVRDVGGMGCWGYGMSGVMGSAGAYNVGARMWPQLIGCALAQELGVLNFGLRVANKWKSKQWRETNMRRQEGNLIVF